MSKRPREVGGLTIGRLARAADVGADTIRFYERSGLLCAAGRTAAGYRVFDVSQVDRVRFIRRAKDLGFTLEEIARLLALSVGGQAGDVRRIAQRRLAEVHRKLSELSRTRDALEALVHQCRDDAPAAACPIIRALAPEKACND